MYSNGVQRARKERKVSIVFRHPDESKHCAGVEALLCPPVPNHKLLFTASRDSTVKRWDIAGPEPVLETSFDGHADWVNDLALIGDLLITASNDQTVRLWKAGSDNGQHLHTLSYHSDYVTCLAAAPTRGVVVSAGLRSEIFLLNIESGKHTQLYPRTTFPPAPGPPPPGSPGGATLGSGGGGGAAAAAGEDGLYSPGGGGGGGAPSPLSALGAGGGIGKAPGGSVYALGLNAAATVVAAGTSEALIRLLDPRSGKKIAKLRGHQDTVRALLVNSDGSTLLSGASDGTIRLWDVGMQRCVQTYTLHSDSVWSLTSPDDSFSVVYSAGRDRALYRTFTHSRTTELLAVEESPITAMALDPDVGASGAGALGVWVATPASHVNLWVLPREAPGGGAAGGEGGRSFSVARRSLGATANRNRMSLESNRQPLVRSPAAAVPGIPGIVRHEVLPDRRRVLTADSRGQVALWDVLTGTRVAAYGKVDFAAKSRELWEPLSVPSWFSSDCRLGCLAISLEPPGCFAAEEYAVALEVPGVADDAKVNYGKLVLDCAFAKWRHRLAALSQSPSGGGGGGSGGGAAAATPAVPGSQQQQQQSHSGALPGSGSGGGAMPGQVPHGHGHAHSQASYGQQHHAHTAHGTASAAAAQHGGSGGGGGASSGSLHGGGGPGSGQGPGGGGGVSYYPDLWPKYWQCRALPAVLCSRFDGTRWRRLLSDFDGSEAECSEVPAWVGDVVLRGAGVAPKEAKCAFVLLPAEGSNLPNLLQSKLNAPRILQVQKVAVYCSSKLQECNIQLDVRPVYLRRPPHAPPDSPPEGPGSGSGGEEPPVLELTCNGVAVPYELSLASVKKFIWKKSDDLVFNYRIRNPAHPAPLPVLSPGG